MGRIVTIIGTRPEIIKMAPVVKALDGLDHEHVLVHSGQHYDLMMDRIFFRDMQLREPDEQFELKEQPPHLQVATTMRQVAGVTKDADLVIVHGDTNTTVAGALLAKKQERRLSHVEAGIRSFDKTKPEELNRIGADQVSDVLFAPPATLRENPGQGHAAAGGLQEESCFFRVPCVSLRENTERPETLEIGSNVLAGTDPARVRAAVRRQLGAKREWPNPFGDGTTGKQIAQQVAAFLG